MKKLALRLSILILFAGLSFSDNAQVHKDYDLSIQHVLD